MNTQKHEISELDDMWDNYWSTRATWELRFCWFPKRCSISNRLLWLDFAYRGELLVPADVSGDRISEYRWHDADEHLIWLLKS